jgi:hypothetical protein
VLAVIVWFGTELFFLRIQNRAKALKIIKSRIFATQLERQRNARSAARMSQVSHRAEFLLHIYACCVDL